MTVSAHLADQSAVRGVRKNARFRDKNCEQGVAKDSHRCRPLSPHMRGSASMSH
jgi:hypothetical protein